MQKTCSKDILDRLLEERLDGEQVSCQIRTLSSIIAEEGIERIDLLKVDVEKSELDVLQGIETDDWDKIRQIVIEVHENDGRLSQIINLLERRGYELYIEQDEGLRKTNLYSIYASQTKDRTRGFRVALKDGQRAEEYFSPDRLITAKNYRRNCRSTWFRRPS